MEDIKITKVERIERTGQEFITAENEGGQMLELTRFPRDGEIALQKGWYARGSISPKPPPDPDHPDKRRNAKFTLKYVLDSFGGVMIPPDELPENDEIDARQKSILVQSDMRTAAMLLQNIGYSVEKITFENFDELFVTLKDVFANVYQFIKAFRESEEAR